MRFPFNSNTLFALLIGVVLCGIPFSLTAQIEHGGTPMGYAENAFKVSTFVDMPFVNNKQMLERDEQVQFTKHKPWRFGEKTDVNLGLNNAGKWQTLPNGDRIWNLGIRSKGAHSINLIFSQYELPEGANVFIYNADKTHFIGSFDHTNNKPHGKLGTTLIKGEAIIIEYFEPKEVAGLGKLTVGSVTHAYRNLFHSLNKDYGDADACTININCPEGDDWQTESKSVVMLMVGGFAFCSGVLLNNTSNDGTPYVLTAEHCVGNDDGSTWVYVFNWESPTCVNANPGINETVSGSIIRASMDDNASDFALFELNSSPPASYNAVYSGWDRSSTEPTRYVAISHPSGDIKKWEEESPEGSETDYWWTSPMLNLGQTEPGSSGCGVWNQDGRVVGQLWGGSGWCNDVGLINYWGRFDRSWNGGGTAATRLKDWLDPTNTNDMTTDHYIPNLVGLTHLERDPFDMMPFPNPGTGQITLPNQEQIEQVEVFNGFGEHIFTTRQTSFTIPGSSSGLYMLRIQTARGTITKKVMINR